MNDCSVLQTQLQSHYTVALIGVALWCVPSLSWGGAKATALSGPFKRLEREARHSNSGHPPAPAPRSLGSVSRHSSARMQRNDSSFAYPAIPFFFLNLVQAERQKNIPAQCNKAQSMTLESNGGTDLRNLVKQCLLNTSLLEHHAGFLKHLVHDLVVDLALEIDASQHHAALA